MVSPGDSRRDSLNVSKPMRLVNRPGIKRI